MSALLGNTSQPALPSSKSCFLEQKLQEATKFFTQASLGMKFQYPRRIKHNKLPLTEHKYDTPAHVSSPQSPFNIQIPYDTNRGKGHHPSCTKLPSFFRWVSACTEAALSFVTHAIPMQFLPKASAKQDPSVIYNGGAHFIINSQAHSLGARPLAPHGGRCHRQRLVSLCCKTTCCKNDR